MIESDAYILAERLRTDFPNPPGVVVPPWRQTAAAKVIDCVLSLRKNYERVVKPRVKAFGDRYPQVSTCAQLRDLIAGYASPTEFHTDALGMNSPGKAVALVGVLEYLLDIQHRFDEPTEDERLRAWSQWSRPGDHLTLDVRGFGLAGFQYLRMLFGAETTKPDVHILGYLADALGRPVASSAGDQVRAVYTIERAGELLGVSVRSLDIAIWEHRTGQSLSA